MSDTISQKPLGVTEASDYWGLSKTYLYKLIHEKKIPCFKPNGGKVFFKQEDLDNYIFRNRVSADYELKEKAEQLLANKKGCALWKYHLSLTKLQLT